MHYNNNSEFPKTFRKGDIINFKILIKNKYGKIDNITIIYSVNDTLCTLISSNIGHNYLETYDIGNELIFNQLKIINKVDFCTKAYGFNARNARWPTLKLPENNKMLPITNLIKNLFKVCDELNSKYL